MELSQTKLAARALRFHPLGFVA